MWTTLPDNGPLSDVVVRTTPCAGQVGVHRPEHQVELAGVQGGQRHELTLKPPRLDGHERWPPLVVGAGAGVDMGPSATTGRLLHGQTAVKSHRHGEHRRAPTFGEHPRMIHSGTRTDYQ